jgi:putative transposase
MRPSGTKAELEARRRQAVALSLRGLSNREVARQVGCVPGSVCRWMQLYRAGGPAGLASKPQAGSKPRLTADDIEVLLGVPFGGAVAAGYRNELWTLSRVRDVIEDRLGVHYRISHVHRLLHGLGFSCQRPGHVAREQDEAQVREFRARGWPAIKKKRGGKAAR